MAATRPSKRAVFQGIVDTDEKPSYLRKPAQRPGSPRRSGERGVKFIADEHIPPGFAKALRGEGYDVVEIDKTVGLGPNDDSVLEYAIEQNRVIISENTDFRGGDLTLDL